MKMAPFQYHRPETVEEALALLAEFGSEAKILAGGQSLLPLMALRLSRPACLVDLGRITVGAPIDDAGTGHVRVAAMTRHVEIERSALLRHLVPLLSAAAPLIGHRSIRNRGTLGGSLAHADPAAEFPAVALAVDAEMFVCSASGERVIPASEFFLGYLTSALAETELLVEVRFPASQKSAGWSVQEVGRRHGDYALAGLAATLRMGATGRIDQAHLSFFGVGSVPVRATDVEEILVGEPPGPDVFEEAVAKVVKVLDPPEDLHATSAYRSHVAGVLTRRCLAEATHRAGGIHVG